uniref:C-type lectin domain-containing protein n=1 Tax=Panagrolaimus superbus TaxID=310955 RepID=A0A914Z6U5_9BILA
MKPPTWNWTDGSLFDFTDWTKGEPKNISGSNCAALSTIDGFWTSQDCFKSKPFACQLPTTPSYPTSANCSMGWYYIPQAHACYGSKGGRSHILNWTASQDYCESFGAQLPSINTLAEFQYLQSFIYTYWKNLWTGIFSVDGGKHWKNSDNTSADDFTKLGLWCSGRPITNISGERCATVYAGCIFDNDCSIGYDTICKKLL